MKTVKIQFGSMNAVMDFTKIMEKETVKADVVGEQYKLCASSFLGLLNMDFYTTYSLVLYENESRSEMILNKISGFLVD